MARTIKTLKTLNLGEGRKLKFRLNIDADPTDAPPMFAMEAPTVLTNAITKWYEGEWSGAWTANVLIDAISPPAPQIFESVTGIGDYKVYCAVLINGETKMFEGNINIKT